MEKSEKNTMVGEMEALDKNKVWDLLDFRTRRKPIGRNGYLRRS